MTVLRCVRADDESGVLALAELGGTGLTNLPPERLAIRKRIGESERACVDADARESGAAIMFVAERDRRIVGVSGIFPRVGAEWPFYSYRLSRQANRSLAVGRLKAQTLLNLVNDFDGETEVGMLFVDPAARGSAVGALAARGRYLFIAAHRRWFARRVIAELRGWQDGDGRSPVWEAIGRHFYDMDFSEADRTGALAGNQFIADLGPRYALYLSLLPAAAQAALGRPHDEGRPAFEMLLAEGFSAGEYVDIFDGGPTMVADIDAVRTVRGTARLTMAGIATGGTASLVAVGDGPSFRAAWGRVHDDGRIEPRLAAALVLEPGNPMWVVPA